MRFSIAPLWCECAGAVMTGLEMARASHQTTARQSRPNMRGARLEIDAGAAFHGTAIGKNLDETNKISCPMSLHFGDKDPVVPMNEVNSIKAAYANNKNADIAVYEGADHSFSMPWHPSYHEGAAKASRQSVLKCFQAM